MFDVEVLIRELLSIDGKATCSVMVCEVTALSHEVLDHAVERRAFVGVFLLVISRAK